MQGIKCCSIVVTRLEWSDRNCRKQLCFNRQSQLNEIINEFFQIYVIPF